MAVTAMVYYICFSWALGIFLWYLEFTSPKGVVVIQFFQWHFHGDTDSLTSLSLFLYGYSFFVCVCVCLCIYHVLFASCFLILSVCYDVFGCFFMCCTLYIHSFLVLSSLILFYGSFFWHNLSHVQFDLNFVVLFCDFSAIFSCVDLYLCSLQLRDFWENKHWSD